MNADPRTRNTQTRTTTQQRANPARIANHNDGDPLTWILILTMFAACLAMAAACIHHETTRRAKYLNANAMRAEIRRQLAPAPLRARTR